jgi:hypothetical protein
MSVLLQQRKNDVESVIFNNGPFKLANDFWQLVQEEK